jgi:hypothetical protein
LILEKYPPKNLMFKYIPKSIHLEWCLKWWQMATTTKKIHDTRKEAVILTTLCYNSNTGDGVIRCICNDERIKMLLCTIVDCIFRKGFDLDWWHMIIKFPRYFGCKRFEIHCRNGKFFGMDLYGSIKTVKWSSKWQTLNINYWKLHCKI